MFFVAIDFFTNIQQAISRELRYFYAIDSSVNVYSTHYGMLIVSSPFSDIGFSCSVLQPVKSIYSQVPIH